MKRLLLLLLLGALLAGSCRCRRSPEVVMPEFIAVTKDTTAVRHNVSVIFQYNFTSIANADKSPALKAIEESNIDHFFGLEGFQGTAGEAVSRSIEQSLNEYVGGSDEEGTDYVFSEMALAVESQARVVDSLLVYTITRVNYTGGAHGMYATEHHNYSIAGGYELSLPDLFDEKQQEALLTSIRQKLYERLNVTGDEGLAAHGYFPEMIRLSENFEVTEAGINFHYDPYQIAAYAVGDVDVSIPSEELEQL